MAGPAGAYAGPIPEGYPGVDTAQARVRDAWYAMSPEQFTKLCDEAYTSGDFAYVATALQANHNGMTGSFELIADRAHQEQAANRLTYEKAWWPVLASVFLECVGFSSCPRVCRVF